MITIYTIDKCLHCIDAKLKLVELKIPFDEIDCNRETLDFLQTKTNQLSMPVIFYGDKVVLLDEAIKKHNE